MSLKVLHLIAPAGMGGAESVVLAGARALRAAGASVDIGVIDETRVPDASATFLERCAANGLPVQIWPTAARVDAALIGRFRAAARAAQWDVVHTHGYKAALVAALGAPRRVSLFATHHGHGGQGTRVLAYVALSLAAYARMESVFAVSDATAASLRRFGGQCVRVEVLHNFLSFDPGPPTLRPADGAPRLVFVGRLSHEKGVDVLLRALAWSAAGASLTVVGDGPERERLEALARDLDLSARVTFVGAVTDVRGHIRDADALVLASRSEGLPMVVVEAAAMGRPVIATDVGGVAEALRPMAGAELVPAEDPGALATALDALCADRAARGAAAMGAVAAVREAYDPSRWATATLSAYARGVARRAAGA